MIIGHLSLKVRLAFEAGELSERRRRRVAAHLTRCSRCQAALIRMRAIRAASAEVTAPSTPDLFPAILTRIRAGETLLLPSSPVGPAPGHGRWTRGLLAGAVGVLVMTVSAMAVTHFTPTRPVSHQGSSGDESPRWLTGLEVDTPSGVLSVEIDGPIADLSLSTGPAAGELWEVWAGGVDSTRFRSRPDGVLSVRAYVGSLRVGVPAEGVEAIIMSTGHVIGRVTSDGFWTPEGVNLGVGPIPLSDMMSAAEGGAGP